MLTTDPWQEACQILPDVNTLTRNAAKQAYEQAGVGPEDLDLVELHDCFATAELVHYDNLMLCAEGGAVDFFESGAPWRDGTTPVNVSGGLQSKGHPIAATGIANIWEVCHHLRGEAGDRQIEGAKVGLAHVIGLGSRLRRPHPGADRGVARGLPMHPVVARVRQLVRRTGFDVTRYPTSLLRRRGPERRVRAPHPGARRGCRARRRREHGTVRAAPALGRVGGSDRLVRTAHDRVRSALEERGEGSAMAGLQPGARGDQGERLPIHIAANSQSSSLLPMLETHRSAAPESAYVGEETVDIMPLDDALAGVVTESDRLCIKLDCQGYEGQVLDGASKSLEQTVMVIMELSLVDLYEGAMRFDEAVPRMRDDGFVLASIDPVFFDPDTQQLLQVDGCFVALPRDGNGAAT